MKHEGSCHCGAVALERDLPDGIVNPLNALTASMAAVSGADAEGVISVAAGTLTITRGLTTDTHNITSLTVNSSGAFAAVAGTDGTPACAPSVPVSVLHIHALDDDRVLFNGGSGSASDTHADFVSVPDTVAKWARLNGCEAAPRRVLEVPGAWCETRPRPGRFRGRMGRAHHGRVG